MNCSAYIFGAVLWGLIAVMAGGAESDSAVSYVLLRDGAVLRGTVHDEAQRILIRQAGNTEIRLPREQVACWAESLEGLYRYQIDQRKKETLDAHLELGVWCVRQRYFSGAAREISAAHRISPGDPQIVRLERQLRHAAEAPREQLTAAPPEAARDEAPAAALHSASTAAPPAGSALFREFATSIQPLLINQCSTSGCHGNGSKAAFRLAAPSLDVRPDSQMTAENLESVLRWIDAGHPESSPLLVRATEPHGGASESPLGPRLRSAEHNFRRWVHRIAQADEAAGRELASHERLEDQSTMASSGDGISSHSAVDGPPGSPVRLPEVEDPFDPELFNRRFRQPYR